MYDMPSDAFPDIHLEIGYPECHNCFSDGNFDEPAIAVVPRPCYPVLPAFGVFWGAHARLMLRAAAGRKNRIKKGEGKDARKDSRDGYDYARGHFFGVLTGLNVTQLSAKVLFRVVALAQGRAGKQTTNLNRWGKRRVPNAYCWLDENRGIISDELIGQCLDDAKAQGGASQLGAP
jgi:hypothetical protein